jgi:hypothetical protein
VQGRPDSPTATYSSPPRPHRLSVARRALVIKDRRNPSIPIHRKPTLAPAVAWALATMGSCVLDGLAHITQDVVEVAAVRLQSIRIGLTGNWSCAWFTSGIVDVRNERVDAVLPGGPSNSMGTFFQPVGVGSGTGCSPSTGQLGAQMWRRNSARLERFKAREPTQLGATGNTPPGFFLGEVVHVVEGTGLSLVSR